MPTAGRAAPILLAAALLSCGGGSPAPPGGPGGATVRWPGGRTPSYANPVPAENARPGDPGWTSGWAGGLQAYLDRVSVRAGETTGLQASSDVSRPARWILYRFGWYGGAGARRVAEGGPANVGPQPSCPMEAGTGMVRCAWSPAFVVDVPRDAVSGYYGVKLVRDDGAVTFAPLVVVDDRPADLLVGAAVNTWQAYNEFGGESLYGDASGTLPGGLGARVSFDRPYASMRGLGLSNRWEIPFARFLERFGYDVSYTTNLDAAAGGADHLIRAGAFLSVGHDEYWPGELRDAVEAARDAGMPLLFFGANVAYWKARYEAPGAAGAPRVLACWKQDPTRDPVSGPGRTGRYRDPAIDRPENALVGVMYESWLLQRFPLVVADASSWLFDGTGLGQGDALPLLGGVEYDVVFDNGRSPAGLHVVARLPLVDAYGIPGVAITAHYTAPSGALVFASGTIDWALGVDPGMDTYDPRVERMSANVLRQALGIPVPAGLGGEPRRTALFTAPLGPPAKTVTTLATGLAAPSGVAVLPDGSLAVAVPREHRIVRLGASGAVEPLAGDGLLSNDPAYDGVPARRARFYHPTALLAMPDGSLLVSDTINGCIRRIGVDAARTVTTFAGRMGQYGYVEGAAGAARFRFPLGLALDPRTGEVLVADSGNHALRAIDAAGNVRTLAGGRLLEQDGPAATAGFFSPTAVAAAPDGTIFVVASGRGTVKRIGTDPARTVTTIAGVGAGAVDGAGDAARLLAQGGAVFTGGRLLVSDAPNYRVRAIVPGASAADTTVSTFAGCSSFGQVDGAGRSAKLGLPLGLAAAPDGRVFVADAANGAIRVIAP